MGPRRARAPGRAPSRSGSFSDLREQPSGDRPSPIPSARATASVGNVVSSDRQRRPELGRGVPPVSCEDRGDGDRRRAPTPRAGWPAEASRASPGYRAMPVGGPPRPGGRSGRADNVGSASPVGSSKPRWSRPPGETGRLARPPVSIRRAPARPPADGDGRPERTTPSDRGFGNPAFGRGSRSPGPSGTPDPRRSRRPARPSEARGRVGHDPVASPARVPARGPFPAVVRRQRRRDRHRKAGAPDVQRTGSIPEGGPDSVRATVVSRASSEPRRWP